MEGGQLARPSDAVKEEGAVEQEMVGRRAEGGTCSPPGLNLVLRDGSDRGAHCKGKRALLRPYRRTGE